MALLISSSPFQNHFQTLALSHMPGDFGSMPDPKRSDPRPPAPDLDAAVFVAVEKDVRGVFLEDLTGQGKDEDLDMDKGGQHVLRYRFVAEHIQSGALKLI